MSKHLRIFDVDGTLVKSLALEDKLFPLSCQQALGIEYVSSNWDEYEIPSDRGIVSELVRRHFNRAPTELDFEKAERSFYDLVRNEFEASPENCPPVPGALEMFKQLQQDPDSILAIATAGWDTTARLKLANAGFEIGDTILCSSSDRCTKLETMQLATERVQSELDVTDFASITYIGDSPEDAAASKTLGYNFVGISSRESNDPDTYPFSDYSDLSTFLRALTPTRI